MESFGRYIMFESMLIFVFIEAGVVIYARI